MQQGDLEQWLPHAFFGRFDKPLVAYMAPNLPLVTVADFQLAPDGRGFGRGVALGFPGHG